MSLLTMAAEPDSMASVVSDALRLGAYPYLACAKFKRHLGDVRSAAVANPPAGRSDPLVPRLSALHRLQIVLFVGLPIKVWQEHEVKAEPPCVDGWGTPGLRVVE